MDKYEYAIEKTYPLPANEIQLNIMGDDGWELTASLIIKEEGNITETYVYYFKRLII
jgi:hypothetical protein